MILPLTPQDRSIQVFDPIHEDTTPNEIEINMGELCIIPANCGHAGKTYTYEQRPNPQMQPLRPAFHFYMPSSLHDFDLERFVPSIGHAIANESYNDYLKKMPGRIVKEYVAYRINEVVTLCGKVNLNDALKEYEEDEANKDVAEFIDTKLSTAKPSRGKKKRQRGL